MSSEFVEDQAQSTGVTTLEDSLVKAPTDVEVMLRLKAHGWGIKRIARELGVSKNTVRRYLKAGGPTPFKTPRRKAALDSLDDWLETTFFQHKGNAAVVLQELKKQHGIEVNLRTVQRAVEPLRRLLRAQAKATVRFETAPGQQLQADFGSTCIHIAQQLQRVHLCVLTLGFSRRIFVRAFTHERRQNWLDGIQECFFHFGGVPDELLIDNARALVNEHDVASGKVVFNPVFADFCAWWGVRPVACAPYRARTKGKDERGVGYVKRNAIAGHQFETWSALEEHLSWWMRHIADTRVHGTTGQRPIDRFNLHERQALSKLAHQSRYPALQTLTRKVNTEACVQVATNSYSVPWNMIGLEVTVRLDDKRLYVVHDGQIVAQHERCFERRQRRVVPAHLDGVVQNRADIRRQRRQREPDPVQNMGHVLTSDLQRPLAEYEALVGGSW